jgi:molybdopterin-containing oxidoreductase family iron-sulfur binding subunit
VAGKAALNVGKNVFPFASLGTNGLSWSRANVSLSKTGRKYQLALTQTHHSIEGRDLIRETTLDKFVKNPKAGNEKKTHLMTMWSEEKKTGHQWAMAIDLNKCNGCSACVVSCNAENNVPVVGREEVLQRREMHWMRIDRYYKGEEANPSVAFQPMTCHHCDNAPCETVCPVLATVHSSDGMNQQVYNRCVGTRYCANNCPYKVRRFNWFDYPHADPNENMVLNPDVTVRSRGVMEKCSLCIQRVQEAKLQAKKEGREVRDGEIKLACQQSCSSDAIIFGDLNDPDSKISKMVKDSRNFTVLEELNVKPRLSYLTKVKNKD